MARRSKLDEHADWLMMRANQPTRKVAEDYHVTFGTSISHVSLVKWYGKRKESTLTQADMKADIITKVTAQVLEGEWVRQLNEIRENYAKAKGKNDVRGMAEWNRQAQVQVSMLLKAWQPIQSEVTIDRISVLREFLENLNDSERESLRSAMARFTAR